MEKWNAFFANTFAQHAVTRRLKADRWLRSQLYSLRRGCGVVELSHEQLEDVAKTYGMVSKLIQDDGFVYKEELVNANGGDASPCRAWRSLPAAAWSLSRNSNATWPNGIRTKRDRRHSQKPTDGSRAPC